MSSASPTRHGQMERGLMVHFFVMVFLLPHSLEIFRPMPLAITIVSSSATWTLMHWPLMLFKSHQRSLLVKIDKNSAEIDEHFLINEIAGSKFTDFF